MCLKEALWNPRTKALLFAVLMGCTFVCVTLSLDWVTGSSPAPAGPSGLVSIDRPEVPQCHFQRMADPFAPYAATRRAVGPSVSQEGSHGVIEASLLLVSAGLCLWMIRYKRCWRVARCHARMAAKLSWALQRGMLQLSDLASLPNKRGATRYPFEAKSRIWWKGKYLKHSLRAVCVDVSDAGVGVLASGPAPLHATVFVQVQPRGRVRQAVVQHCQSRGSEYFLGLKFTNTAVAAA